MLDQHGFEPVREAPTQLRLRNCPFQPFAAKATDLVCGLNHAFVTGYLQAMEITGVQAVLAARRPSSPPAPANAASSSAPPHPARHERPVPWGPRAGGGRQGRPM
jgi:hypothetical protein